MRPTGRPVTEGSNRYCEGVNLVTSGNAVITVSTCIVGLLLVLPKGNLREAARFAMLVARSKGEAQSTRVTNSPDDGPAMTAEDHEPMLVNSCGHVQSRRTSSCSVHAV